MRMARSAIVLLSSALLVELSQCFAPLGMNVGTKYASQVVSRHTAAQLRTTLPTVPTLRAAKTSGRVTCSVEKQPGLVLGPNNEQDWFDTKCFGRPVVKRYVGEGGMENWRMWYSGRDSDFDKAAVDISTGRTGLCESTDGITWKRVRGDEALGSVLDFNAGEWWSYDTVHTCPGDVAIISTDKVRGAKQSGYGVNFMYLFGGDAEEVNMGGETFVGRLVPEGTLIKGLRMRIGLALSYDGVHWTRIEGDHHSGAVFDVGDEDDFDSLMNGWPQVVQHKDGDLRMYYSTYDRKEQKWCVGLARSTDGFKWQKAGRILEGGDEGAFDEMGVSRTWTVQHPETGAYHMFCEGVSANGHAIGLYTSKDGLRDWVPSGQVFAASADNDAWDSKNVAFPCVVPMDDGSCRLYYSCNKDGKSGIGMAVSEGNDWTKFVRHQH